MSRAKVLIVDDDGFMHELYVAALSEHYDIDSVRDGLAALQRVEQSAPDLVLLDVQMAGIDGYETCRRVRARHPHTLPVLFVSGRDRTEDRVQGYEAGGDDYLIKPFDPLELRAKIDNLLRYSAQSKGLRAVAEDANRNAVSAMTYLGEMGALLETIRAINACGDAAALAQTVAGGARQYGLNAVARVHAGAQSVTDGGNGELSPLMDSLLHASASGERIVQRAASLCITYEHAALLIGNMPLDAPERCGRLRDLLAILADAANERAKALGQAPQLSRATRQRVLAVLEELSLLRERRASLMDALADDMRRTCTRLGLSEAQRTECDKQVQAALQRLRDNLLGEAQAHQALAASLEAAAASEFKI